MSKPERKKRIELKRKSAKIVKKIKVPKKARVTGSGKVKVSY